MFFIPYDKKKTLFFLKASLLWEFLNRHIVFFESSGLKEVRILQYLYSNNTVLIPEFQNIAIVYYIILDKPL